MSTAENEFRYLLRKIAYKWSNCSEHLIEALIYSMRSLWNLSFVVIRVQTLRVFAKWATKCFLIEIPVYIWETRLKPIPGLAGAPS